MEHTDGHGDDAYPPAPLPAHERDWRHPSEVGADVWRRSEPPLSIGRGLLVVTTACCSTLAATLAWAMLTTHPGRLSAVVARAVATEGDTTTLSTDPATMTPPTYRVEDGTVRQEPAIAVPLADGRLILTTTHAVSGTGSLQLRDADGHSEQAHVVLVDVEAGLVVLVTDTEPSPMAYRLATALDGTDELHFDENTVVVVRGGTIADRRWFGLEQHEGSPVVNQRGELVGLCSRADHGMRVVVLEEFEDLLIDLADP